MRGVVEFMRGHELWRLITENDSYGEMEATRIDADWQGDGLILFRATEAELAAFRKRGIAVVIASSEGPDGGFPRVVPDNAQIGRAAAAHLIERNFDDLAFLARGETYYQEEIFAPGLRTYARQRLRGFSEYLSRYSLEPTVHYLRGRPLWKPESWRQIQTEVMAFLETLPQPCGLFTADDSLGAVALKAADLLGMRVPQDLAVIGYGDDHAYCYSTFPALSSIEHPGRAIGFKAAECIQAQLEGGACDTPSQIVPIGPTIARESSDTLSIEDPIIFDLVSWIRHQAPHDPIRVSELAERSGLSMTTLKHRFAEALGHSPKQEIKSTRLIHLKRLLLRNELTLGQIAEAMKFTSAHQLSRFFQTETGERPSDYRARISKSAPSSRASTPGAVIFDMDGTLFDSEELYFRAYQQAYADQQGKLSRADYFTHYAGTSNSHIEACLIEQAPTGFKPARFRTQWKDYWHRMMKKEGLKTLPGVRELLTNLRQQGAPMALASSSDRAEVDCCLNESGLWTFFDFTIAGDEVTSAKPDPSLFLRAAEGLHQQPEDCLVIEDSIAGIRAGNAAGMHVIHVVSHPATNSEEESWLRVRSLAEIEWPIIRDWLNGARGRPGVEAIPPKSH